MILAQINGRLSEADGSPLPVQGTGASRCAHGSANRLNLLKVTVATLKCNEQTQEPKGRHTGMRSRASIVAGTWELYKEIGMRTINFYTASRQVCGSSAGRATEWSNPAAGSHAYIPFPNWNVLRSSQQLCGCRPSGLLSAQTDGKTERWTVGKGRYLPHTEPMSGQLLCLLWKEISKVTKEKKHL